MRIGEFLERDERTNDGFLGDVPKRGTAGAGSDADRLFLAPATKEPDALSGSPAEAMDYRNLPCSVIFYRQKPQPAINRVNCL